MKSLIISVLIFSLSYSSWANDSSAVNTPREFKILSWNIFMIPKPFNFTEQSFRAKEIANTLPQMKYDVYFFQEAFWNEAKNRIQDALKSTHPYQAQLETQDRFFKILDSGLMVVSKIPFKVINKDYYKDCRFSDCFASKGVLLLEFALANGKKLQVATTHAQASNAPEAIAVRNSQYTQVKNLLSQHKVAGVSQMLIGDLNIDALESKEFLKILDLLKMSSGDLTEEPRYTSGFSIQSYYKPGNNTLKWIDHILIESNQRDVQIKNRKAVKITSTFPDQNICNLSDHYAIESSISF